MVVVARQVPLRTTSTQPDSAASGGLKIGMIVPGGVDRSGTDRVIDALLWQIERLARRHELHVFATHQEPDPGEWDLLGARVHNVGTARGTTRRLLASFGREHRAKRFDVVHAFFGWSGVHAALIGWRHGLPVLFHATGGEFLDLSDIGYGMRSTLRGRIALRIALAGASRVSVTSEGMQRLALVSAERIPLGVALDRWPVRAPRQRNATEPIRLLHVGDIRPVKDQTTLIRAVASLMEVNVPFTLDVAGLDTTAMSSRGTTSAASGTEGSGLQASPAAQRLGDRVRWHGVLRRAPLRALMESADLLVMSSRHEAGPVVVLEAAIAGVPTVGTSVGHIAEWAPSGAVAVPVGDAAALAREIAALASDETRRLALAHEAQRRAVTIDANYTTSAFERVYSELCAAPVG
jgi:glycosyltransferase involved in cell wall biosynthesis